MTRPASTPRHVIHEAVNPVGARIQREWLRRVMEQAQPTLTAPPARDEQPTAPRAG